MTITLENINSTADTAAQVVSIGFGGATEDGSALIAVIGVAGIQKATKIERAATDDWNLLYEFGGQNADQANTTALRGQIWGAFDTVASSSNVSITFPSAGIDKGIFVAEYRGDVFAFPNPADRVVSAFGTTVGPGVGTLNSGTGGTTREAVEMWIGAALVDQALGLQNEVAPFVLQGEIDIGVPAAGNLGYLDAITSGTAKPNLKVDHDVGAGVEWVAIAAAIRGDLQIPVTATTQPAASEPVTEFEDYSSDGIGKLAFQYRART
jgi:hypothetical protein